MSSRRRMPPEYPRAIRSAASASPKSSSRSRRALLEHPPAHPVELPLKAQVLAARGLDINARTLRHDADRATHAVGFGHHVGAGYGGFSLVRARERGQHLHRGRLSGPIRSEQGKDRAPPGAEGQAVQRANGLLALPVRLDQPVGLDHRLLAGDVLRLALCFGLH